MSEPDETKEVGPLPYATPVRVRPRLDRFLFGMGLGLFGFGLGIVLAESDVAGAFVMGFGGFLSGISWPVRAEDLGI